MKRGNSPLTALTGIAVDAIREILTNPDAPASVRLRAARLVLEAASETDAESDNDGAARPRPAPTPKTPPFPISRLAPKIGRNDYCPCGSGLKFKKCCLPKLGPFAHAREGPPNAAA